MLDPLDLSPPPKCRGSKGSEILRLGKRDQHQESYTRHQKADLDDITATGWIGIEVRSEWIVV